MTATSHAHGDRRLRDDLAAVMIDGDIVVYDAVAQTSHVLTGGAVAVWVALEEDEGRGGDVGHAVARLTGEDSTTIRAEVERAVEEFGALGFFDDDAGVSGSATRRG